MVSLFLLYLVALQYVLALSLHYLVVLKFVLMLLMLDVPFHLLLAMGVSRCLPFL